MKFQNKSHHVNESIAVDLGYWQLIGYLNSILKSINITEACLQDPSKNTGLENR